MNKVKLYDPYYIIDPTTPHDPIAVQGTSHGGKFTYKSPFTGMGDGSVPIDAPFWARYSRGARNAIDAMHGEEYRFSIVPDETVFSWRMLCEMYEAALKTLRAGGSQDDGRAAAWGYLQERQADLTPEGTEQSPIISGGEVLYCDCPSAMADDEIPF